MPSAEALNFKGLDIAPETIRELLVVDPEAWRTEMDEVGEYLGSYDERTPHDLMAELADVVKRL